MIQNLDLYTIFLKTARCKSISDAARELHISQPAVSLAITKLENELGVKLLFRTNRGISLTSEGSTLLGHITGAFAMIESGEDKLRDISGLKSGTLRIGASDMTLRFFLLDYLERFRDRFPGVKLNVTNAPTPSTLEALKSGLIDFGVISEPCGFVDTDAMEFIPVRSIRDVFICTDKYPLFGRKISADELRSYPLILLGRETSTRRYIDDFFGSEKLSPSIELATSDLILEFARRGIGVTCIVEDFALSDLKSGKLRKIELERELPARKFMLAYLKKLPLSAAAANIISEIKKT